MAINRFTHFAIYFGLILLLLGGSSVTPGDKTETVRAFTRNIEFDYVSWTLNAVDLKIEQSSLKTSNYLDETARKQIVLDYIQLIETIQNKEAQLYAIYADPKVNNPEIQVRPLSSELDDLYGQRSELGPLAEAIIQGQLSTIIAEQGLTLGGQPLPPVLYHSTPLPSALIVSPRDVIRQDANISLLPDITLTQQIVIEDQVDKTLNKSSLVVGIGGVGVYPTMVMQTTDLNWLAEVIAHEWTHNYLSLRPLGISYLATPELRTMNETTASISGKELGRLLIERYYPELAPPPPAPQTEATLEPQPQETDTPPQFDFQSEMHTTRVTVDKLLSEKKIGEAETYMEERRVVFWDHGYLIRKMNQAYFAFYGAYADQPGGAAGADPVGAAVRLLRQQSPSLTSFVKRISWMWSFQQLQNILDANN
jgi:hypothetical protein